jgi:MscS family membrane protein
MKNRFLFENNQNADSRGGKLSYPVSSAPRESVTGMAWLVGGLVIVLVLLLMAATAGAQHPLKPLDTSSPRATIASFLAITDDVARRYAEYRNAPSPASERALQRSIEKGQRLLDLREVAPSARYEVKTRAFVLLWEVMARLELPDLNQIPDADADTAGSESSNKLAIWRIPHTEITIAQVKEGGRAGEFLFSPETVERLPEFYEMAREMPYLRAVPMGNVYRAQQLFTGWMIPIVWVEALPDWATAPILGLVLWKWLVLLILFGLALSIVTWVWHWGRRRPWDGSMNSYLRYLCTPVTILIIVFGLRYLIRYQIRITGSDAAVPEYVFEFAFGVAALWIVWLTSGRAADAMIATLPRIKATSLDAHLVRLSVRSVGLLVMLVLAFHTASDLGIPIYGIVAGAGVGGLGIALAAKSTLENFLGTLNLYADRPVRVGDFCRYGEDPSSGWMRIGTVEEIGLRSTRIRGIDRTVTTIPNSDFANMHIVNMTRRDRMLLKTEIRLSHETTSEQLRIVLAELRAMLRSHRRISEDPARVSAIGSGAYSFDLEIFAYVDTSDWNDFLVVQEDIFLHIIEIVKKAGAKFAIPFPRV